MTKVKHSIPSADGDDAMLAASTLGPQSQMERLAASRLMAESLFARLEHHVPGKALTPVFTSLVDGARSAQR